MTKNDISTFALIVGCGILGATILLMFVLKLAAWDRKNFDKKEKP